LTVLLVVVLMVAWMVEMTCNKRVV
jgi:hypothetical protein